MCAATVTLAAGFSASFSIIYMHLKLPFKDFFIYFFY